MRRALGLLLVVTLVACAGAKTPPAPPAPVLAAPTPTAIAPPTPTPTPILTPEQLSGGWSRANPQTGAREGLLLRPDGTLGLPGNFGRDGVAWRLDGGELVLTTLSEPHPEVQDAHLRVEEAAPFRLVLAEGDPLAGIWERRDFAILTGTVTHLQPVALTPEATVQVDLRDVSEPDAEPTLLARQVIRRPGQAPIAFALDYDPEAIEEGRTYAVSARIADRGQLAFITESPVPVFEGGPQAPVEIVAAPVR